MSRLVIDPDLERIGAVLKQARLDAGRSQRDVAAAVGIPQSKFPLLERGEYRPTADKLMRLAAELGLVVALEEPAPEQLREAVAS